MINQMEDVAQERQRQDEKWGIQDHATYKWLTILMEEVGEASKAALESDDRHGNDDYREEMVQVAAVALAAIECHDRAEMVRIMQR